MIIFKPKSADQTQGKDVIVYRDYSLRKRIETTETRSGPPSSKKKIGRGTSKEETKEEDPKLQCLEVDIVTPLNNDEWNNFLEVIDETKGLGWFQVLPVGQKSSQPYQFNMLHVIPEKEDDYGRKLICGMERLPLDAFITQHFSLLRKRERMQVTQSPGTRKTS